MEEKKKILVVDDEERRSLKLRYRENKGIFGLAMSVPDSTYP
jgi:hypothetical protein